MDQRHTNMQTYVVKPGDTLTKIARQFNIPLNKLLAANPQITDPDCIFPGQVIMIPVTAGSGHHQKPCNCPGNVAPVSPWNCGQQRTSPANMSPYPCLPSGVPGSNWSMPQMNPYQNQPNYDWWMSQQGMSFDNSWYDANQTWGNANANWENYDWEAIINNDNRKGNNSGKKPR